MRGMRKNRYLQSFVMIGQDIIDSHTHVEGSQSAAATSLSTYDTSQVTLAHVE